MVASSTVPVEMVVSITLFLGIFFQLVALFVVLIVLSFLIRIAVAPMKLFWDLIRGLT